MAKRAGTRTRKHKADLETRARRSRQVRAWLYGHLSDRHGLPPGRINLANKLEDWGYGDRGAIADLAAHFNKASLHQADWAKANVTPPELAAGAKDGTFGGVVDFLTDKTFDASATAADGSNVRKSCCATKGWLHNELSLRTISPTVDETDTFEGLHIAQDASTAGSIKEHFATWSGVEVDPNRIYDEMGDGKKVSDLSAYLCNPT